MRPWGQWIKLFNNAEGKDASFYFYIDSSYVQLAVMYGLVLLGLVLRKPVIRLNNWVSRNLESTKVM